MSDEEKKAIEKIKKIMYMFPESEELKLLLNLIEKQQKEIEELKQIKCKLDEKNIPIETLLAEFERLEDLEDDLTTVYLNGVYDGEKKVQDKIKAKIEEVDENGYWDFLEKRDLEKCKEILQSLLEKE